MTVTIDRLGRIVVPKSVRERYRLVPGTALELDLEVSGFHLKPVRGEATLIRKDGVLIHHGTDTTDIDVTSMINADRERRAGDLVAEEPSE